MLRISFTAGYFRTSVILHIQACVGSCSAATNKYQDLALEGLLEEYVWSKTYGSRIEHSALRIAYVVQTRNFRNRQPLRLSSEAVYGSFLHEVEPLRQNLLPSIPQGMRKKGQGCFSSALPGLLLGQDAAGAVAQDARFFRPGKLHESTLEQTMGPNRPVCGCRRPAPPFSSFVTDRRPSDPRLQCHHDWRATVSLLEELSGNCRNQNGWAMRRINP